MSSDSNKSYGVGELGPQTTVNDRAAALAKRKQAQEREQAQELKDRMSRMEAVANMVTAPEKPAPQAPGAPGSPRVVLAANAAGGSGNGLMRMVGAGGGSASGSGNGGSASGSGHGGKTQGRGKGGKGLSKGGAKRHRNVKKDAIKGIKKPAVRRLARRGGVKRASGLIYDETRSAMMDFLKPVIRYTATYTEHAKRKTVTTLDVVEGLKKHGVSLWV
jgi:histone H4